MTKIVPDAPSASDGSLWSDPSVEILNSFPANRPSGLITRPYLMPPPSRLHIQPAAMADEVYRLQLRQLAAGEAAGYEPLQLYAQAVQARNALALARANYHANWRQLAAALGRPDLPPTPLAGPSAPPSPATCGSPASASSPRCATA